MKRIKIATWFRPGNYGTGLQALALAHFLELENYDVRFIDYSIDNSVSAKTSKIRKLFDLDFWTRFVFRKRLKEKNRIQSCYMEKWIKTFEIKSNADFMNMDNDTDIYISGGDQIWNPYFICPINFLVGVSKDIPKISFGTSVGVNHIPDELRDFYIKYLSCYDYISVREKTSQEALANLLNIDIGVVNDPTMLFNGEEWDFLISDHNSAFEKYTNYILCYFVGENKSYWNFVKKICKKTGYKAIVIPINEFSLRAPYKKAIEVSPADFLFLIKNASIICTDSFHATLFSIQFGKEFYVLKRFNDNNETSQNHRIVDLLNSYGIFNRLIQNENEFNRLTDINYEDIHKKIEFERDCSIRWLNQHL